MDFLKKIFGGGGKSEDGAQEQPSQPVGATGGGQVGGGQPMGGESKKEDHDQGHPSGQSGKNVCEFC